MKTKVPFGIIWVRDKDGRGEQSRVLPTADDSVVRSFPPRNSHHAQIYVSMCGI